MAELDERELISTINYLGAPVSVPLQGSVGGAEAPAALPGIPTTGAAASGAAGGTAGGTAAGTTPAGIGEIQNQALRALTRGSAPSGTEAASGGARAIDAGTSNLSDILGAAGKGVGKAQDIIEALGNQGPSHALDPESRQAFESQRAGERADLGPTNIPESGPGSFENMQRFGEFGEINPGGLGTIAGPGFDVPGGIGESMGEWGGDPFQGSGGFDIAGALPWVGAALGTGMSAFNAANATNDWDRAQQSIHAALYGLAPVTGGITALAAGGMDALNAILGAAGAPSIGQVLGFAPSDDWMAFAPTLAGNLGTTQNAIVDLAKGITGAETADQLSQAAGNYRNRISSFAGGFGQGAGPYDLPTPPGATGTEHEGGLEMDFGGLMRPMQDLMSAKQAFLASPSQAGLDAQRSAVDRLNAELTRLAALHPPRGGPGPPDTRSEYLAAYGLPQDYGAAESSGA